MEGRSFGGSGDGWGACCWVWFCTNYLLRAKWLFFQVNQVTHDQAVVLQSALQSIPNPSSECMLRNVSIRLAQQISDEVSIKLSKL